jgi:Ran GTPase-activating protein (RanGAP) involved in mRNA processing and transport
MKQNKKDMFLSYVKNKIIPGIDSNEKEKTESEIKEEPTLTFINNNDILNKFIFFFNIREQFKLIKLNSQMKNIIIKSKLFSKYLKIRQELNEEISIYKYEKKIANSIVSISKKIKKTKMFDINQLYNKDLEVKNDNNLILNLSNDELPKKKFDFEKLKFDELFGNNGDKIKKIIKKYKLNPLEERIIVNGLIEAKLLDNKDKIKEFILNNANLQNAISFFIPAFINLNQNLLVKLNLSSNNFTLKDMKYISNVIKLNSNSLSLFNISDNNLEDNCCKILFHSLVNCINLTNLNISNNKIGSEGFSYLEDFFGKSEKLNTLVVKNNLIGSKGISYLNEFFIINPKVSIRTLDISYNGIQFEGIQKLCNYIIKNKKLISLFIGGNYIGKKGIELLSETLIKNENIPLAYLFLENNELKYGIEDVSNIISNNKFITLVDIKNNILNDDDICKLFESLKAESKILTLDLSLNVIDTEGIKAIYEYLKKNQNLRQIILNNNFLSEKSCVVIKKMLEDSNVHLKNLSLEGCQIKSYAVLIFEGLKKNTILDSINLADNNIGILKEKFSLLSPCLKENKNLKELNLDSNAINNECLKLILDGIAESKSLKFVSFRYNKFERNIFYVVYDTLEKNKNLKKFDFTNSGFYPNELEELQNKIKENSIVKKENHKNNLIYDEGLDDDKKNKNTSDDINEENENEINEDVSSL